MWYILLYILYIWYSVPEQEYTECCRPAERMRLDIGVDRQVQVEGLGACASVIAALALLTHPPLPVPLSAPFLQTSVNYMDRLPRSLAQVGFRPRGTGREESMSQVFRPCLLPGLLQLALSLTLSHRAQLLLALVTAPPWASPRSCPHFYKPAIR